jgi:hypothetical protein
MEELMVEGNGRPSRGITRAAKPISGAPTKIVQAEPQSPCPLWCQGHGGMDSPQRHRGHEGNARTDGSKEMAGNRGASRAQQNRSAVLQPKLSKQNLNLPGPSIASRPLCLCGEFPPPCSLYAVPAGQRVCGSEMPCFRRSSQKARRFFPAACAARVMFPPWRLSIVCK